MVRIEAIPAAFYDFPRLSSPICLTQNVPFFPSASSPPKMPSSPSFSFANTLPLFLLLLSTVSGCSPTAPSSDPTKTNPACCEPLKVLGSTRFRIGHLLAQYDQPKHKCLTSVRLHCKSFSLPPPLFCFCHIQYNHFQGWLPFPSAQT